MTKGGSLKQVQNAENTEIWQEMFQIQELLDALEALKWS